MSLEIILGTEYEIYIRESEIRFSSGFNEHCYNPEYSSSKGIYESCW